MGDSGVCVNSQNSLNLTSAVMIAQIQQHSSSPPPQPPNFSMVPSSTVTEIEPPAVPPSTSSHLASPLECQSCRREMCLPVRLPTCQHCFCRECVANSHTCPLCHAVIRRNRHELSSDDDSDGVETKGPVEMEVDKVLSYVIESSHEPTETCANCDYNATAANGINSHRGAIEHQQFAFSSSSSPQQNRSNNNEADSAAVVVGSGAQPMYYCETCQQPLCANCQATTHQAKIFNRHRIVLLEERGKPRGRILCPTHNNEPYILFCFDSKKLMCIECFNSTSLERRGNFVNIDLAHRLCCERLERGVQRMRMQKQDLDERLGDARQRLSALDTHLSSVEANLSGELARIVALVESVHLRLLNTERESHSEKKATLEAEIRRMELAANPLRVNLLSASIFCTYASKMDLLHCYAELQKAIQQSMASSAASVMRKKEVEKGNEKEIGKKSMPICNGLPSHSTKMGVGLPEASEEEEEKTTSTTFHLRETMQQKENPNGKNSAASRKKRSLAEEVVRALCKEFDIKLPHFAQPNMAYPRFVSPLPNIGDVGSVDFDDCSSEGKENSPLSLLNSFTNYAPASLGYTTRIHPVAEHLGSDSAVSNNVDAHHALVKWAKSNNCQLTAADPTTLLLDADEHATFPAILQRIESPLASYLERLTHLSRSLLQTQRDITQRRCIVDAERLEKLEASCTDFKTALGEHRHAIAVTLQPVVQRQWQRECQRLQLQQRAIREKMDELACLERMAQRAWLTATQLRPYASRMAEMMVHATTRKDDNSPSSSSSTRRGSMLPTVQCPDDGGGGGLASHSTSPPQLRPTYKTPMEQICSEITTIEPHHQQRLEAIERGQHARREARERERLESQLSEPALVAKRELKKTRRSSALAVGGRWGGGSGRVSPLVVMEADNRGRERDVEWAAKTADLVMTRNSGHRRSGREHRLSVSSTGSADSTASLLLVSNSVECCVASQGQPTGQRGGESHREGRRNFRQKREAASAEGERLAGDLDPVIPFSPDYSRRRNATLTHAGTTTGIEGSPPPRITVSTSTPASIAPSPVPTLRVLPPPPPPPPFVPQPKQQEQAPGLSQEMEEQPFKKRISTPTAEGTTSPPSTSQSVPQLTTTTSQSVSTLSRTQSPIPIIVHGGCSGEEANVQQRQARAQLMEAIRKRVRRVKAIDEQEQEE